MLKDEIETLIIHGKFMKYNQYGDREIERDKGKE